MGGKITGMGDTAVVFGLPSKLNKMLNFSSELCQNEDKFFPGQIYRTSTYQILLSTPWWVVDPSSRSLASSVGLLSAEEQRDQKILGEIFVF